MPKAKKQAAAKAAFTVRSAESRDRGVKIKGAASDSDRIGHAAREGRAVSRTRRSS